MFLTGFITCCLALKSVMLAYVYRALYSAYAKAVTQAAARKHTGEKGFSEADGLTVAAAVQLQLGSVWQITVSVSIRFYGLDFDVAGFLSFG